MTSQETFLLPTDSSQFYLTASRAYAEYFRRGGLQPTIPVFGTTRSTDILLYADRTESTLKRPEHDRKYAFLPEHISDDPALLAHLTQRQGWRVDRQRRLVVMPSENFCWAARIIGENLILSPLPETPVPGSPYPNFNYHLEFRYKLESDLAHWYNWVSLYIHPEWAFQLHLFIQNRTGYVPKGAFNKDLFRWEPKQTTGKREDMVYTMIQPSAYVFSYAGFSLAEHFLRKHGFRGEIPVIAYSPAYPELSGSNPQFADFQPQVKVGVVKTSQLQGDYDRHMQIAIKLAQIGARDRSGSRVRGVVKRQGSLRTHNMLAVPYRDFAEALARALQVTNMPEFFESMIGDRAASGVRPWGSTGGASAPRP